MTQTATESSLIQYARKYEVWIATLAILITNLLTLGRYTFSLGIYYDEYVTFYVIERFGWRELINLAGGQAREAAGILIGLAHTNYAIGHIIMFVISTGCALLLLWLVRRVFSDATWLGGLVGLLYLLYPAYFMRVYLTALSIEGSLLVLLISFVMSYFAVREKGILRWLLVVLSILAMPLYISFYEMSVVAEILRPFVILAAMRDKSDGQSLFSLFIDACKWSVLWVIAGGVVVVDRLILFEPYGFYETVNYNANIDLPNNFGELFTLVFGSSQTFQALLFRVWQVVFTDLNRWLTSPIDIAISLFIAILSAGLTLLAKPTQRDKFTWLQPILLIIVGFGIVIATHAVFILTGRPLSDTAYFFSSGSRFYIITLIGILFIILGTGWLLTIILPRPAGKIILASFIAVMLLSGSLVRQTWRQQHTDSWLNLRDFMWQLSEIAPNLEDGTVVIVDDDILEIGLSYITFSMGDLFYDNTEIFFVRADDATPDNLPNFALDNGDWGFSWQPTSDAVILAYRDTDACVQILDPSNPLGDVLSDNALAVLPILHPTPSDFILDTPIDSMTTRLRYFPRPETLACEVVTD